MGNQRVLSKQRGHLRPRPALALPLGQGHWGSRFLLLCQRAVTARSLSQANTDSLYSHTCRNRLSGELKSAGSKLANVGEVCHGNQTLQTEPELLTARLE